MFKNAIPDNMGSIIGVIVGVVAGVLLLVTLTVILVFRHRKVRRRQPQGQTPMFDDLDTSGPQV